MPKIPRDISGQDLIKKLKKQYNFSVTRQTRSHIRLTSTYTGKEYHITIPAHNPIKIGTFNNILTDLAGYLSLEKKDVIDALFG